MDNADIDRILGLLAKIPSINGVNRHIVDIPRIIF